ncbi:MAG: hypothetical protein HOQ07_03105 [Sinomonas sp.]|nr:hypothetical protein [Sinomonas sp.]
MSWVAELRTTALVGTARRAAPAAPPDLEMEPPDGLANEESLLDQAALADVVARTTRHPQRLDGADIRDPAPPDDAPPASGDTARLLDLLLTQSPVSRDLQAGLVKDWLDLAASAGCRVPHRLLPALIALADSAPIVAEHLHPAIGTRGKWLQELDSPQGRTASPAVPSDWTELTSSAATAELERLRRQDAAAARDLLASHWDALGARERAAHLAVFTAGLGPADEALLERALDDKAKSVREVAVRLLDGLPESARAERMAERLRPLLHVKGLLRKQLEISLPPDPDAAAVRDGIAPNPRGGEPDRLGRLETIVRGAPLEVWTVEGGGSPASALAMLSGESHVVDALVATAALRSDLAWARALLEVRTDLRLVRCLPPPEREIAILRQLRKGAVQPAALVPLLRELPVPWSLPLADGVLDKVMAKGGGFFAAMLAPFLPMALPLEAAGRCRRLLQQTDDDAARRRLLRDIVQYQSFRQSLTEAFS